MAKTSQSSILLFAGIFLYMGVTLAQNAAVRTPIVSIYFICENATDAVRTADYTAKLEDYYASTFEDATGISLTVDADTKTCFDQEDVQVQIESSGALEFSDSDITETFVKDRVSESGLENHLQSVCEDFGFFEANIYDSNETNIESSLLQQGFEASCTPFSDVVNTATVVGIVLGALICCCFTICCIFKLCCS